MNRIGAAIIVRIDRKDTDANTESIAIDSYGLFGDADQVRIKMIDVLRAVLQKLEVNKK